MLLLRGEYITIYMSGFSGSLFFSLYTVVVTFSGKKYYFIWLLSSRLAPAHTRSRLSWRAKSSKYERGRPSVSAFGESFLILFAIHRLDRDVLPDYRLSRPPQRPAPRSLRDTSLDFLQCIKASKRLANFFEFLLWREQFETVQQNNYKRKTKKSCLFYLAITVNNVYKLNIQFLKIIYSYCKIKKCNCSFLSFSYFFFAMLFQIVRVIIKIRKNSPVVNY